MIKAIVIIILISVLALTFTATMINVNNYEMLKEKGTNNELQKIEENNDNFNNAMTTNKETDISKNVIKEKTLETFSTYNENDLVIDQVDIKNIPEFSQYNIKVNDDYIFQISGLKDKTVEKQINDNIKNEILEKIDEISNDNQSQIVGISYPDKNVGFSNVLSLCVRIDYKKGGENNTNYIGLNYELKTGNRLKFEDIFTSDTHVEDIIRFCMNRSNVRQYNRDSYGEGEFYDDDPFFNEELSLWQVTRHYNEYDYKTDSFNKHDEVIDILSLYSDYDIAKIIRKGIGEDDFFFSTTLVSIILREKNGKDEIADYYLKDIAKNVVIYDKYLTDESLFEADNIGRKNIITCSQEKYSPCEKQSIFKSDNFFYDYIPLLNLYTYNYEIGSWHEPATDFSENLINNVNKKIDEIIDYYEKESIKNKDKAYFLFVFPLDGNGGNMVQGDYFYLKTKLIKCDIKDKTMLEEQLFNNFYRYRTLAMYGSLLYREISLGSGNDYGAFSMVCDSATYEEEYYYYNIDTGEFLFKDIAEIYSRSSYDNMGLEWIEKKYNEIFARHGHDFKSQELREHFSQFDWYKPIPGKVVTMSELSQVEVQNANLLKQLIEEKS